MISHVNQTEWENKYMKGYGNQYVESHIVRIYFHIIKRYYGLTSGRLFDWGMGNGINAEFFKQHGFNVFGCDVSAKAIENALARMPELASAFSVINACDPSLGMPNMTFDLILANESIYYLDDNKVKQLLTCIRDRMSVNSLALVTWISKDHYYFNNSSFVGEGLYKTEISGRQNETFMINFKSDNEAIALLSNFFHISHSGYYDCLIDEGSRMHGWYLLSLK